MPTRSCLNPIVCEVCNRAFSLRSSLKKHFKPVHGLVKDYIKNSCGNGFFSRKKAVGRMRVHTREKCFKYNICLAAYGYKGSLRQYMATHSGLKPFVCFT